MELVENLIRLLLEPDLGPVSVKNLLQAFGDSEGVLGASEARLRKVRGLRENQIQAALRASANDPRREIDRAVRAGVELLAYDDPRYPRALWPCYGAPFLLYVKGRLRDEDNRAVGVVGTRAASRYALEQAARFGEGLARAGHTVVSGLARGVDSAAHRGALACGGRTVAVLGCGLGHIYPEENRDLAAEITSAGALVSEFPMELSPSKDTFPRRNRIIAGWSRALLVVEAPRRSGALITAEYAARMGRMVFALPGRVDQPATAGCHALIREGAILATEVGDILRELPAVESPDETPPAAPPPPRPSPSGASTPSATPAQTTRKRSPSPSTSTPTRPETALSNGDLFAHASISTSAASTDNAGQSGGDNGGGEGLNADTGLAAASQDDEAADRAILRALDDQPRPLDALVSETGLPVQRLSARLMMLEMRRAVERHPGNLFARASRR